MSINYSQERLEGDIEERKHILNMLLHLKSKYAIQNKKVIELGCGMGQNLMLFQSDNQVIGYEGIQEVVDSLNSRNIEAHQINLELPIDKIATDSVDVLMCLDVLEHLNNPYPLVGEMYRVLKKDGLAIINVPNQLNIKGKINILKGSGMDNLNYFPDSHDWDNPHIRFYTHQGIIEMFSKNQFKIKEDLSPYLFSYREGYSTLRKKIMTQLGLWSTQNFVGGFFMVFGK